MRKILNLVPILVVCAAISVAHGQSVVPGAIQAEDYDAGANGVTYYDATSGNEGGAYRSDDVDIETGAGVNGHNVGWIDAGEWLEFTVNITTSANYEVRYAVASQEPGPFSLRLSVDGQPMETNTFIGTGGWQNWANITSPTPFALSNGIHTVRLDFLDSTFNIDEFEFIIPGPIDTNVPPYLDPTNSVTVRVDDLMSRMSLDEKIGQMTQAEKGSVTPAGVASSYMGSVLSGGGGGPGINNPLEWANMIDAYQAQALTTPLKIPILYGIDAVHGHNNVYGAVMFPHNIGLGATRNPELIRRAAEVTAAEVLATGAHWTFAPCIAVARHEAWGRTYESFAEIPELAAELGAAAIIGYQGTDLLNSSSNIIATAKHFAGDGGTQGGIDQGNTILDEATFRELHVSPYIDAIEAGAKTIMVSYSSWNGIKMHGHEYMLTGVLKEEMGFEGFLISDWAGVDQITGNYYDAVVQSINAGMDMVMVPYDYMSFTSNLKSAVLANDVSMDRIDDAVRRILTVKFESGLFENPYAQRDLLANVGSTAHREVARQAVAESLVVLKDDPGLLPLSKNLSRIHVAGKNADDLGHQCGGWSISWQGGSGDITIGTTILEAIENTVSPGTTVTYSENGTGAAGADVGIVVVGETPYAEGAGDTSDLFLSSADLSAIDKVRQAGIPVIVILVSGRPMFIESELADWDALIAAWLPGTEGQGVADVLFGDTFPVGILSFSWPRNNAIPVNLGDAGYNPLFPYGYSVYVDGDMDADGLTDRWEAMHGLDPYDDGTINPDYGATGDPDGDEGDNTYEFNTGTHPQLAGSIFRIVDLTIGSPAEIKVNTVPGYSYGIDYADMLGTSVVWNAFANPANGVGTWLETSSVETNFIFVDDFTSGTSGGAPADNSRFYRIRSTAP